MSNNIMYGGQQYNCRYLNKYIKPCRQNNNQQINSVLVRSREANEKQETIKSIVRLEKRVQSLEERLEAILSEQLDDVAVRYPCLVPQDPVLLQKSKQAMMNMNLSARINNVFRRINQLAIITDTIMEINNIRIRARYQPGVKRYNICVNIKIARQRLDLLNQIITDIEENPDDFTFA